MNNLEAYQEGLLSLIDDSPPNPPLWARAMGFSQAGCYAFISQDELGRSYNGLQRLDSYHEPAYLEIVKQPANLREYKDFFRTLEMMDVNLLPSADTLDLICYGASMSRTRNGATVLNGRFQLAATFNNGAMPVQINLRASLVLSKSGTHHTTLATSGVVGYFKVPCQVTMDPDDFNLHWSTFAAVDNPLFGFFNPVERSTDVSAEKPISLATRVRRKLSTTLPSLSQ